MLGSDSIETLDAMIQRIQSTRLDQARDRGFDSVDAMLAVAEIRHRPVVAGLDEEVVVKALQVLLDQPSLPCEHRHQRPERFAALQVALPDDRGQQFVEFVGGEAHGAMAVSWMSVSARVSRSAA